MKTILDIGIVLMLISPLVIYMDALSLLIFAGSVLMIVLICKL